MCAESSPVKKERYRIAITPALLTEELELFVQQVTSLRLDTDSNYNSCNLSTVENDMKKAYHYDVLDSNGEIVNFEKDVNRRCYVFHYSMGHILGTFSILNKLSSENNECFCHSYSMWLNCHAGKSLKICSIGGGPGTDVFALQGHLKYVASEMKNDENKFKVPTINDVCILDKCNDWKDMYDYLHTSLALPAANFVKFDFKKIGSAEDNREWRQSLQNADIVTMIKFATAVMIRTNSEQVLQAQSHLKALVSQMKTGALLLYVDTDHAFYAGKAANVFREANFQKLFEKSFECDVTGFDFGGVKPARRILLLMQVWCC